MYPEQSSHFQSKGFQVIEDLQNSVDDFEDLCIRKKRKQDEESKDIIIDHKKGRQMEDYEILNPDYQVKKSNLREPIEHIREKKFGKSTEDPAPNYQNTKPKLPESDFIPFTTHNDEDSPIEVDYNQYKINSNARPKHNQDWKGFNRSSEYPNKVYQNNWERNEFKPRENLERQSGYDQRATFLKQNSRLSTLNKHLPIFPFKDDILQKIQRDQVVIISGDTGCGKSTQFQVPKYLLEEALRRGERCRVICTQPRRIAAMSLAKRVQAEIQDAYPDADPRVVGYQIGMEAAFSKESKVIFVTNGIFLQRFIHEDDTTEGGILKDFTHIILDEVHERDIDSDFIMIAIKSVLLKHSQLKLILMSATINAEIFAKFFSRAEIQGCSTKVYDYTAKQAKDKFTWDRNPIWDRNERSIIFSRPEKSTVPINPDSCWGDDNEIQNINDVKMEVLTEKLEKSDDIDKVATIIQLTSNHLTSSEKYEIQVNYLEDMKKKFAIKTTLADYDFSKRRATFFNECIQVCIQLIEFICSSNNYMETSFRKKIETEIHEESERTQKGQRNIQNKTFLPYMLIFLPGLGEIYHVMDMIADDKKLQEYDLDLVPLHSTLSDTNQQRLFEEPRNRKQRKIILATNIAESSITIPSVLYVVDFCLLKEINCNGKSGIEILDLTWASKASLRQRAGRTGRVSDGYCFRLIPEQFYKKELDDFSKPELLRSPLDKLILRIKTLHENEKNTKKRVDEHLFSNPKVVLGRAIEPPQLESIGIAMKNLQDCGALTAAEDSTLAEITYLGKVYCDLPCEVKISKLILLGLAFEIGEEVITLGSILSQKKCMFKPDTKTFPRNRFAYMKALMDAADGTESDHIAMTRIYSEWEEKFVDKRMTVKMIKRMSEKWEEKTFCREKTVDPMILREIYITKLDIKLRLRKLGIIGENLREKYFWFSLNTKEAQHLLQDCYQRFKFVIAGGFFFTYIRQKDAKKDWNVNQSNYVKTSVGLDPLRTIIVRHSYSGIENWEPRLIEETELKWRKMLRVFKPEKIKFIQDKAYIQFSEKDIEFALKTLTYLKRNPYEMSQLVQVFHGSTKSNSREELTYSFKQKNNNDPLQVYRGWLDEEFLDLFQHLGDIDYYNNLEFVDFCTRRQVKTDAESINNVIPFRGYDSVVALVADEYVERKTGVLYARFTTCIDFECRYALSVFAMIFAPQVHLQMDDAQTRYKSIYVDSTEVDLGYYLNKKEIDQINRIRYLLQTFFLEREKMTKTYTVLWEEVKSLFKEKRLLYQAQEKWEIDFQREWNQKPPNLASNPSTRLVKKGKKRQEDKEYNLYLIQIRYEDLPNGRYFTSEEAALAAEKYYLGYSKWKREKLEEIKRNLRLIDQTTTKLACGICGTKLCDFLCIGDLKINGVYRHLNCSDFIFKQVPYSQAVSISKLLITIQDVFHNEPNLKNISQHRFLHNGIYINHKVLGCFSNHGLAVQVEHKDFSSLQPKDILQILARNLQIKAEPGIHSDPLREYANTENIYLTYYSNLKLVFPDNSEETFNFDTFNLQEMMEKNYKKLENRKHMMSSLVCKICMTPKLTPDDYKKHMKERSHNEMVKQFEQGLQEDSSE